MQKKFKFLVLIPARGGSKRIKNKNLKILNGKPLIDYTINTALKSKFHKNDIYVSSESDKIEKYIKSKKISFIKRPKELAKDTSSTFSVIKHFVQNIDKDFDFLVLLQPTSPLRKNTTLSNAINMVRKNDDCIISVQINDHHLWRIKGNYVFPKFEKRERTQLLQENVREDGSIYILPKKYLFNSKNILGMGIPNGKKIKYVISNKIESFEIDDIEDFQICSKLIKH